MRGLADGRGMAVVMATHDAAQALRADRLVVLSDGLVAPAPMVALREAA